MGLHCNAEQCTGFIVWWCKPWMSSMEPGARFLSQLLALNELKGAWAILSFTAMAVDELRGAWGVLQKTRFHDRRRYDHGLAQRSPCLYSISWPKGHDRAQRSLSMKRESQVDGKPSIWQITRTYPIRWARIRHRPICRLHKKLNKQHATLLV